MFATTVQVLPLALGVLVNPLPILAMVLMLLTGRARSNGLSFLAGWVAGLAAVSAVAMAIANASSVYGSGGDSPVAAALKISLGAVLLALAGRKWSKRPPPGQTPPEPGWMKRLDTVKPAGALGLGALLAAANPKNLVLTVAAATVIAEAGLDLGTEALILLIYAGVATLGVAVPLVVYLAAGERAVPVLSGWRTWLTRNSVVIMTVVLVVIGLVLIAMGLSGVVS